MARRLRTAYRRRRHRLQVLGGATAIGAVAGLLVSLWLGERIAAAGLGVGPAELQRLAALTLAAGALGWGIGWLILRLTAPREDEAGNLSSPS